MPSLDEQLNIMRRAYGDGAIDEFTDNWMALYTEVAHSGFRARAAMSGGVMSVVMDGTFNEHPAVAKICPSRHMLGVAVDATRQWGPEVSVGVHASGPNWVVFEHGGDAPADDRGDSHAPAMLDILNTMHNTQYDAVAVGDAAERVAMLIQLATTRPAVVEFLGGRFDDLYDSVDHLHTTGTALCHGDPRDNNWVTSGSQLRIIDPDPFYGPAAADVSRWILGGGAKHTASRAALCAGRGDRDNIAAWLKFWTLERSAALAHHGWDRELLETAVTTGLRAAEYLRLSTNR